LSTQAQADNREEMGRIENVFISKIIRLVTAITGTPNGWGKPKAFWQREKVITQNPLTEM
jgi:hypothetical protein